MKQSQSEKAKAKKVNNEKNDTKPKKRTSILIEFVKEKMTMSGGLVDRMLQKKK